MEIKKQMNMPTGHFTNSKGQYYEIQSFTEKA